LLQQNVEDLQAQLVSRPADSPSSLGDELAQLILQVSAFSSQSSELPVQIQVPSSGRLSDRTVDQQAAYLAGLTKTIETKRAEANKRADALLPETKVLQGRIQETSTEATRLRRQRDLAEDVYATLALKARETSISAQTESGSVRLASSAATPDRPVSRKLLTNTVIGLVLGFLTIAGVVFAVEYFRAPVAVATGPRPEHHSTGLLDANQ
jgi:uncharacterized protein involved in exopolysaccharide biosynthesis